MNTKNIARLCLVLFFISLAVTTASANAVSTSTMQPSENVLANDPRYTNITRISSGLTISTLGRASCTGSSTLRYELDSTLTMVLQQFKNDRWTDIKEWSENYSGSGPKLMDKSWYVSKGYRYRMVTTIKIYEDGEVIETVSCDSPIKEY